MRICTFALLLFLAPISAFAQGGDCRGEDDVPDLRMGEDTRREYETNLAKAKADYESAPDNADAAIWYGRRIAYLGKYRTAIEIFSDGMRKHPDDPRFLRHRGHRFISIRCFDEAITDLERAADMVKGKPDEIEPDGLPNARNIPTSTLKSNIFYHLGLAYYLKGDFKNALKAYEKCLKVSKNPDMFVATQNWHYLSLMRLGKKKEAEKVLASVKDGLDIIENDSYYKLLKLYAGKVKPEALLTEIREGEDGLQNATMGYGIGTYFLIHGDKEKAETIYRKILETDQWSSFGYIAAEAELARD